MPPKMERANKKCRPNLSETLNSTVEFTYGGQSFRTVLPVGTGRRPPNVEWLRSHKGSTPLPSSRYSTPKSVDIRYHGFMIEVFGGRRSVSRRPRATPGAFGFVTGPRRRRRNHNCLFSLTRLDTASILPIEGDRGILSVSREVPPFSPLGDTGPRLMELPRSE